MAVKLKPKPRIKPKVDVPGKLPGGKPKVDVPGKLPGGKPKVDVPGGKKPSPKKAEVKNLKGKSEADIKKSVGGKTLNGKKIDDIAADPKVIDAAKKNKNSLKKLGIGLAGGAAGLAALMIIYGEANPLEAIKKALDDAGETVDDVTGGIGDFFKKITDGIKKFGFFIGVGIFILIFLSVVGPMIFRMFFKKTLTRGPPPPPYNHSLYAAPPGA